VFAWHFTHSDNGYPVPFDYVPALFPFSLLDEGHTGVALFMTLSGYLFAKLLDGRTIDYRAFLWNRALRLLPLLVVVILIVGVQNFIAGKSLYAYAYSIARGVYYPSLPNGGWSITVEFHYYVILPLFLWMLRKSKLLPISIVVGAIALRLFLYHRDGEIQELAFWTIIGRIDQFALGMLVYQVRAYLVRRHLLAVGIIIAFAMFYWYWDMQGGFLQNPSYPSPSPLWIFLPTIEGTAYAVGIAWYESSFSHPTNGVSGFIGRIGEYSYSIYLLHFFFVFYAARFVHERIMDISNFYLACLWAAACFLLMMPAGYLSFRFIEAPFLRLRKRYIAAPPGSQETLNRSSRRSA
jgi:peptidoglycan/LPS O-acetylase OafA/YrhL